MKLKSSLACVALAAFATLPTLATAQNVAIVNGKPVPKARADALLQQALRSGQAQPGPELEARVREEVVLREIFTQEAERRGLAASAEYKTQMDLVRQSILIRELFSDYQKKNPSTDAEVNAEYEKLKGQNTGTEYRARHILVEKEEDAKALLAQLKAGGNFDELAKKNSKDPGSAARGGDLDFARPENYVPEFGQAMAKLKKGELTDAPVKTQFGFHIIRLDDTREAQFPPLTEVRPQIEQRLVQIKLQQFQESLRSKAKTDFKFSQQ